VTRSLAQKSGKVTGLVTPDLDWGGTDEESNRGIRT